jgi:hypothetical protein
LGLKVNQFGEKMITKKSETKNVFISYVKTNSDEINQICTKFKENGIHYWLDRDRIEPGKLWKHSIKDAISNGAYFLACFSKEYEDKSETYMNEEILVAIDILRKKGLYAGWFIPIKLSPCNLPPLEIGAGLALEDIQYLNLYEDWNLGLERLVDLIKQEEDTVHFEYSDDYLGKEYTYRGLKKIIESGDGFAFHNADLGHPVYHVGASNYSTEESRFWEYADSPDKNRLFKMLSKLSKQLKTLNPNIETFIWWYDFSEWKDFCKFALDVYNKKFK